MGEEVKEVKKEVKNKFLLDVINLIKLGYNPSKISSKLNISKQQLNYYISSLKKDGLIYKRGYGTWEVKEVKKSTKVATNSEIKFKEIRGHGFVWKVKVPKESLNYNSVNRLNINNIKFKLLGIKKTPRILHQNKKIWLGNKNIIIYDTNSYLGEKATESKKYAVYRLICIIEGLEKELKVNLKTSEGYQFKPSRQHYAIIKNDLAHQYNKENKKLEVRYKGETWFIIDNSYNLDEAETIHKESAMIDNLGMQKFFNELKELNFEATPKETWKAINQVTANQIIFAENMRSHINAINTLSSEIKRLGKIMNNKITENTNLKLKLKNQTKLGDF
jgi:DNA-binding transcriptional ArsR family regulator